MSHLKLKYGERCKTKSTNSAVLEVYELILKNENVDSDYWNADIGPQELHQILEDYFTEFDWKELEIDLIFWTNNQLEIFLFSIMNGYTYNLNHDNIFKEKPELIEKLTKIVPNKTDLILPILRIGLKRENRYNDIILTASEEMYFFINHFYALLNVDKKYLNEIKEIIEIIGTDFIEYTELKAKMDKASR